MGCNCKWVQVVIGLVVVIFTLWPQSWSKWLVVIAGAAIVLHAFSCKSCGGVCAPEETGKKSRKKKRK